jgi:hypothetical protein
MAIEEAKIGIEKLNSTDFGYLKIQIEDILYGKDLYQSLIGITKD